MLVHGRDLVEAVGVGRGPLGVRRLADEVLGADLEILSGSEHENTPLGWAIVAGHAAMVDGLIERGAQELERWARIGRAEELESREVARRLTMIPV